MYIYTFYQGSRAGTAENARVLKIPAGAVRQWAERMETASGMGLNQVRGLIAQPYL